jgi:4,5-DOPA dioxygenase extradiol
MNESSGGNVMNPTMPVLFISHGSPDIMLKKDPALADWRQQVAGLPQPKGILVVSAHWETASITVGGNEHRQTIHDFYGFPPELYEYQYSPPSACEWASDLSEQLGLELDNGRGLDHGSWVPLSVMFPDADISVVHLSVAPRLGGAAHFQLGQALAALRSQGILIIASGVVVHNLSTLNWRNPMAPPEPWAREFMAAFQTAVADADWERLFQPHSLPHGKRAVPTLEHYLPFLVAAGAAGQDSASLFCDEWRYATLGMHCYRFAPA